MKLFNQEFSLKLNSFFIQTYSLGKLKQKYLSLHRKPTPWSLFYKTFIEITLKDNLLIFTDPFIYSYSNFFLFKLRKHSNN